MNHVSITYSAPTSHSVNGLDFETSMASIPGTEAGWDIVLGTVARVFDDESFAFKPLVTGIWTKPITKKRLAKVVRYEATKAQRAIAKKNA